MNDFLRFSLSLDNVRSFIPIDKKIFQEYSVVEVPVSLVDGAIVSSEVLEASLDSDSVVSDRFVEGSVEIVLFSIILHPEKKIDIHNTRITK